MLENWLAGRSLARGLPPPVPDRGGLRVDTNSSEEVCRWIFLGVGPELVQLAEEVSSPGYLLKVFTSSADLRAALPASWQVEATGYFMTATSHWESSMMPSGYKLEVEQVAAVTRVEIRSLDGELAASGYAAETAEAFVYVARHRQADRSQGARIKRESVAQIEPAVGETLMYHDPPDGPAFQLVLANRLPRRTDHGGAFGR